ncbi:hypothetical protein CBR_g41067 [Chara braunii]|uniref:Reverse transcriptase domain-containing protein n=1 Tax=Chara braunii TaxID=69332 RepID=A0A388LV98_CHABU|nr:hypothetical protein CBR_g41067 [Chara braunii]|eukprot:GBG86163.1 hypothetical protein CBR_g41067 [Chara braunii]
MPIDKLMHLYSSAGSFQEKSTRKKVKDVIANAVSKKACVNVRKKITVKVRFRKEIKKSEIRHVLVSKISCCELHPAITGLLSRKLRVVWRRNRSVSEILCNHKAYSKKEDSSCTCAHFDLPRSDSHILTRIADVGLLPQFVLNGKNVTCPKLKTTEEELSISIRQGLTAALGQKVAHTLNDWQLGGCFMSGCNRTEEAEEELVFAVKRKYRELVISQVDRNAGDLVLMCPLLYQRGLYKMFTWNAAYDIATSSEKEILTKTKKDYLALGLDKVAAWDSKGAIGKAYVLPKHKDLTRWRPIVPATNEPTKNGSRLVARALNYLLAKLPAATHFNLGATAQLKQNLQKAEKKLQLFGDETMVAGGGFDIKEMFTSLPHAASMEALRWLLQQWKEKGYSSVTVSKRGKFATLGVKFYGKSYVKLSLQLLLKFVSFELKHTFNACKGMILRQRIGVPMGKNSSPPLACLMCAKFEVDFLKSLGKERRLVHGVRFMDDVSLTVAFNRGKERSVQRAVQIMESFQECYGSELSLARTDDESNTFDFIGAQITITAGNIHFFMEPEVKNEY